jgi:chemotaxis protein histidine kinase CheA
MTDQMERPGDIGATLRAFNALFLQRLPARVQELEATLELCLAQPSERTYWINLHRQLHTFAGSSGTFGFADMGQAARRMERAAHHFINQMDCAHGNEVNAENLAKGVRGFLRDAKNLYEA